MTAIFVILGTLIGSIYGKAYMQCSSFLNRKSYFFAADFSDTKTWIEEGRKQDETNIGDKFGGVQMCTGMSVISFQSNNFQVI